MRSKFCQWVHQYTYICFFKVIFDKHKVAYCLSVLRTPFDKPETSLKLKLVDLLKNYLRSILIHIRDIENSPYIYLFMYICVCICSPARIANNLKSYNMCWLINMHYINFIKICIFSMKRIHRWIYTIVSLNCIFTWILFYQ